MTGGITGWVKFGREGVEVGAAGMLESVIVRGRLVMGLGGEGLREDKIYGD